MAILARVFCGDEGAAQIGCFTLLALPHIAVFVFEGLGNDDIPRAAYLDAPCVERREGKVRVARLSSTSA